jgi:hypothetical protein
MQTAFETTKQKLANVNTLTIIQPKGDLILETDASGIGIGAVLLQIQNGTEKPIAYYSKTCIPVRWIKQCTSCIN